MTPAVTRGHGLLEGFLARQRAKMASKLIPPTARSGRLLDIGCGSFPFFLSWTEFAEKYGLDKVVDDLQKREFKEQRIHLIYHDLTASKKLPFEDNLFDVVTMLAVFEHIEPQILRRMVAEIHRVLKPGGRYILTTPAGWTDGILKILALLRFVSPVEIKEHQDLFNQKKIRVMLENAGFQGETMRQGSFELGMNLWAVATK